ncbi:MAG TPA: glycerophosphodiester phosphodiesterase family protein [Kofleriaceae bacterium]|nr:glycerophosphodiester phosphodiesterase family protein [Kofleriaceae bacterium]
MAHDFRLYAHRGASAELPENTLPAFRRALEIGVDALEMDVHLTRDGHPIVSHDPDAHRMGGVAAAWRDLDLAEAQRIDLGQGFVDEGGGRPHAGKGIRAPSFEEVLVELPGVRINVDIKQWQPPMVRELLRLIRRLKAEDRVTLASFQVRTLLAVRRRGYGGETALARAEVAGLLALPISAISLLPFVGDAAQVPVRAGPVVLARPGFLAKCHQLGMRVDFWTINDPAEARRLVALGADGIMTDDPARLAPALRDVPRDRDPVAAR